MTRISLLIVAMCLLFPRGARADVVVSSDASWLVTAYSQNGWMNPAFDDSRWSVSRAPTRGRCDYYADPIFFTLPMWSYGPVEKGETYFRKKFTLEKEVLSARLRAGFDDDGDVYINGTRVLSERSGKTEKSYMAVDVSKELHKGENTIALYAVDSFGGCQWAQVDLDVVYDSALRLDVPLLKQTDPLWGDHVYDHSVENPLTCGQTIGDCGCAMTSLAMLLQYYGVDRSPDGQHTNPDTLNKYFTEGSTCSEIGCASKGYVFGAVRWNAVNTYSKEANGLFGSPKVQFLSIGKFSKKGVIADIQRNRPVILKAPHTSHWFIAYGFRGDDVLIHDPFFKREVLSDPAYMGESGAQVQFEKVQSDFSLIEVFSKKKSSVLIVDIYGRRAGVDVDGKTIKEIPNSSVDVLTAPLTTATDAPILWIYIQRPASGAYFVTSGESFMYTSTIDAHEKIFSSPSLGAGYEVNYVRSGESVIKLKSEAQVRACYK